METPTPSLLDWLNAQFGRPPIQRLIRIGLAVLFIAWGVYQFFRTSSGRGNIFLGTSLALVGVISLLWGLAVKDASTSISGMPELSFKVGLPAAQVALPTLSKARPAAGPISLPLPLTVLGLGGVLVLAIFSQTFLTDITLYQHKYAGWGVLGYLCALAGFVWLVWKDKLLGAERPAEALSSSAIRVRWWWLGVAAITGLYAYFAAGKNPEGYNEFRPSGVLAWLICV